MKNLSLAVRVFPFTQYCIQVVLLDYLEKLIEYLFCYLEQFMSFVQTKVTKTTISCNIRNTIDNEKHFDFSRPKKVHLSDAWLPDIVMSSLWTWVNFYCTNGRFWNCELILQESSSTLVFGRKQDDVLLSIVALIQTSDCHYNCIFYDNRMHLSFQ